MLTILQKYVVNWYPGTEHTEATISQHYYWPNLRDNKRTHIKVCNTYQKNRKQNLRHGKLPAKEAETIPWDRLSVDLIGPYKIIRADHDDPLIQKDLTMIDLVTGWFEIEQ